MNLLEQLPQAAKDLILSSFASAFTTVSKAGVPIDTPLLPFPDADLGAIGYATGLAYPAKAERARRNPKVGLLFEGRRDEPVVAIAGMAAVKDSDIEANAIRYISETGLYGVSELQPWEIGHKAVWYWSRIIMEVTPKRVLWWESPAAMDGPPTILEQLAETVYATSDPAPTGKPSAAIDWPMTPWHDHIQSYLKRGARGQLSAFDAEGFPMPVSARSVTLEGDTLVLDIPKGIPWTPAGTACFTFEGTATFVGQVSGAGAATRFAVERMIPYMPMVVDGNQVLLPEGKEGLMERLHSELARRGQPLPQIPTTKPTPTAGSRLRRARIDGMKRQVVRGTE